MATHMFLTDHADCSVFQTSASSEKKKKKKKKKRLKGDNNKALWSTKSARYPTKD